MTKRLLLILVLLVGNWYLVGDCYAEQKWERVESDHLYPLFRTYLARGWLVKNGSSIAYVPDEKHEWKV